MDLFEKNKRDEIEELSSKIPALFEYALSLERHEKHRYLQKIAVVGVDHVNIPCEQFHPKCSPSVEQSDLFGYLVLHTSFCSNNQFKNYKSLQAYNQVLSGFVASVKER